MKFYKSRLYTSVNADELKRGDIVIVADDLAYLKKKLDLEDVLIPVRQIEKESEARRITAENGLSYFLAYLVKRA